MKKALIWLIIIAVIVLIGYRGWVSIQKTNKGKFKTAGEAVAVPVEVEIVKQVPFIEKLSLTGGIKGIEKVKIFPKVSGKLYDIKVKEGDRVKKGSVIALIDRDITGLEFKLAEVTSPIRGVISGVYLDKGAGVGPENPLAEAVNIDTIIVTTNVVEKDISKVKLGQKAHIKVDAYPDTEFYGMVTLVSPTLDSLTHSANMEITIPNPNHLLKPGMFAEIELVVSKVENLILIPRYAILIEAGKKKVFVIKEGKAEERWVETGFSEEGMTYIKSGLVPLDSLVTSGQGQLQNGDKIKIAKGEGI
jgi:multidrug efflux pump subunit AcrA (membrane-fusion protein)